MRVSSSEKQSRVGSCSLPQVSPPASNLFRSQENLFLGTQEPHSLMGTRGSGGSSRVGEGNEIFLSDHSLSATVPELSDFRTCRSCDPDNKQRISAGRGTGQRSIILAPTDYRIQPIELKQRTVVSKLKRGFLPLFVPRASASSRTQLGN